MIKFKDCKKCGEWQWLKIFIDGHDGDYMILMKCENCNSHEGCGHSIEDAIADWNKMQEGEAEAINEPK